MTHAFLRPWLCALAALLWAAAQSAAPAESPDFVHQRVTMLMGGARYGRPGDRGFYFKDYGLDEAAAFTQLVAHDGFNCFDFTLNREGRGASVLHGPQTPMEQAMANAGHSGMVSSVRLLAAGYADDALSRQHPDWQVVYKGKPFGHFGPWLCVNSPYFRQTLLPAYQEFFAGAGRQTACLILWENQGPDCRCDRCQKLFAAQTATSNYRQWARENRLRAWRAIRDAVRETGWKGTIIGGGYGSYEWEAKRWDQTLTARNELTFGFPEIEAFQAGIIDLVMPELYTHNTFPAGAYRREDIHYVYRSLLYERSVFGQRILPNVELYWDGRSMTPDELFRWLLEAHAAGYDSYSVVSEGKLYLEHVDPTEDQYRSAWRAIFRAFSSLPAFGRPEVRFQFVVSQGLERALYRRSPQTWDWYVGETSRLFQALDRRFGGGAVVNEAINQLPPVELHGVTDATLRQFVIVPKPAPPPHTDATYVKRLDVEPGQSLAPLETELSHFLASCAHPRVLQKSPLVYVNWNRSDDGQEFCSVINHGAAAGSARIFTAHSQGRCILDSTQLCGRQAAVRQIGDVLELDLDAGAAIVFSVQEVANPAQGWLRPAGQSESIREFVRPFSR